MGIFTETTCNAVHLVGTVLGGPVFDHKVYGQAYYMIVLGILRKSGYEDRIRLMVSERILGGRSPKEGEMLEVDGQIRTYNKEESGRSKLEILVFVRDFKYIKRNADNDGRYTGTAGEPGHINEVGLEGFICKPPVRRTSPLGREICDLMVAVNRAYNKSDYIPAIAWGRNAAWCECLDVGDKISIEGRIQSRNYRKTTDDGSQVIKTAYEVSIVGLMLAKTGDEELKTL